MRNIKQIQENIKASGLTGQAYNNELRNQALLFAKELAIDIICVPTSSNLTWEDALLSLAHITEVYFEMIRTDNAFTFAEHFQIEVFGITPAHSKSYSKWRSDLFGDEHTPDEAGEQQAAAVEPETEPETAPIAEKLAQHQLQIMANKISHILQSDKLSDDAKEAFRSIVFEAGNESGIGGIIDPELLKTAFPLFFKSLGDGYGRGVINSLTALLDSDLVSPIEDELKRYEKRFDGRTEDELRVLDLSRSTIEDLARKLSDIMHNPHLPKRIKGCIEDELHFSKVDLYTPENILSDLKDKLEVAE